MATVPAGEIRIEYNGRFDEWDIDSPAPLWIHTAANTRDEAISTARSLNDGTHTIKIKGPRMSSFKNV